MAAGTNILAGVNARKAGTTIDFDGPDGQARHVPVYADCAAARQATGARTSVVFVPPRFAKDAMVEAIEAGITLIVVVTEGIPVADTAYCVALARERGCRIVGPNCPGLMTMSDRPNGVGVDLGIIPQGIAGRGPLGLASTHMTKPIVAYIAGFTAPEGKQMGHAGAIISGGKGTAADKKEMLESVGIKVGTTPGETARLTRDLLREHAII